MRPWRRFVLTLTVVSAAAAVLAAQQRLKTGVDLVHFSVIVADKTGAPVTGLTAQDFELVEEGAPQAITYFSEGDPADGDDLGGALPLHLGLALDGSGSMDADMREVRTAVIKFLNANRSAIDVTLVDFDTQVNVTRYGDDEFPRLVERIRARKPDGWTAFYDAIGVYLNGAGPLDGEKILLIYTDGGDTRSELSFAELMDLLRACDVTVYAIGYLEHQSSSARIDSRHKLQQMAAITGGQAFFPSNLKELDKIYDGIHREIAARYSLGYVSANPRFDGEWRKVQVKLRRPDLKGVKVRTRNGYFAPYKPAGF